MGNNSNKFFTQHVAMFMDKIYMKGDQSVVIPDKVIDVFPTLLHLIKEDAEKLRVEIQRSDEIWFQIPETNSESVSDSEIIDIQTHINRIITTHKLDEDTLSGTPDELRAEFKECKQNMCTHLIELSIKEFYADLVLDICEKYKNDVPAIREALANKIENMEFSETVNDICSKYQLDKYPLIASKWMMQNFPTFLMMKPSFAKK